MKSPLMTSVVGTSTEDPRPNAPLAPAAATTTASPATAPTSLRLLPRHMPLHRHARLQAGRDYRFVIVHRAERDRSRPGVAPVQHPHRERVLVAHDGIAGYHDDVVLPFELDVDGRRQ